MDGLAQRYRRVSQFHESPSVLAAWQRAFGPLIRWSIPSRRRAILAVGALVMMFVRPFEAMVAAKGGGAPVDLWGRSAAVLLILAFAWGCHQAARNFAQLPEVVRRRPQLTLHGLFWLLLAILWGTAGAEGGWRPVLIGVAVAMPVVLWRLSYMLLSGQRGKAKSTTFADQVMVLFPVWGGSSTPYGKGLDYLARNEAQSDEALARSNLAAVKLFLLAALWAGLLQLMNGAVYGEAGRAAGSGLGVPSLSVPLLSSLIGSHDATPIELRWASVYAELVRQVLRHAAEGHVIIGLLRLFGFNVFRNTYKPLLAESVVGFWNRYYYYFKELLSEFFFFPTFARRFKAWPRVRLFAAVLAAAFVGNMYYHLMLSEEALVRGDAAALWQSYSSRAFYCLLLALGIFVSMVREQGAAGRGVAPSPLRRIFKIAGVWTFFAIIFIWNARGGADFATRCDFFLSLFGLS